MHVNNSATPEARTIQSGQIKTESLFISAVPKYHFKLHQNAPFSVLVFKLFNLCAMIWCGGYWCCWDTCLLSTVVSPLVVYHTWKTHLFNNANTLTMLFKKHTYTLVPNFLHVYTHIIYPYIHSCHHHKHICQTCMYLLPVRYCDNCQNALQHIITCNHIFLSSINYHKCWLFSN